MVLFAWDENHGKVVIFYPRRAHEVRKTGKTFVRPRFVVAEFLKGSFNVFSGDGEYNIIIHFFKNVTHRIREKRWPGQQQLVELPNGEVELHMKLTSLVEVHPWLMTFKGDAYPLIWDLIIEAVDPCGGLMAGLRHLYLHLQKWARELEMVGFCRSCTYSRLPCQNGIRTDCRNNQNPSFPVMKSRDRRRWRP